MYFFYLFSMRLSQSHNLDYRFYMLIWVNLNQYNILLSQYLKQNIFLKFFIQIIWSSFPFAFGITILEKRLEQCFVYFVSSMDNLIDD
jgi:predicted neutral ceramidase superfamily lipid hydrolase